MRIAKTDYTGVQFYSSRTQVCNKLGEVVNCHYTNMNRSDIDWIKLAKFIARRYYLADNVKINIFGCSDGSEVYTLLLALKKLPARVANKFKIFASDISPDIIDRNKKGEIYLHQDDLKFLKETDGLKYFEPDVLSAPQLIRGKVFYKYRVKDELKNLVDFSVKDIRKSSQREDFSNQVVCFRNGWTFNSLNDQEMIANGLKYGCNENSLVIIGQYDLFKSDANRALQTNGFRGIESDAFVGKETNPPGMGPGEPIIKSSYPEYIFFEKKPFIYYDF